MTRLAELEARIIDLKRRVKRRARAGEPIHFKLAALAALKNQARALRAARAQGW